jgi:phosphomannomutase
MNEIILFDIDGTLTEPRKKIQLKMIKTLLNLKHKYKIGCIGGSDYEKAKDQIGENNLFIFDYWFFENGLVYYKNQELQSIQNLKSFLGDDKIKKFVNYVLHYIADLDIPIKRGTFVEFRNGMINISPIGRNCSQEERDTFEKYDKEYNIRNNMINILKTEFSDYNLTYSIGGQISFDVFPNGWNKTFALQYLSNFDKRYFIGDKIEIGGNDYEIYESPLTISYKTIGPDNTIEILQNNFLEK